ncbi:DUF3108 domain-containing protein [Ferruginibacter profundus]
MRKLIALLSGFVLSLTATAQKSDTVFINGKNLHPEVLKEGTHRYLVYFKKGEDAPRSEVQFWNIDVRRTAEAGKPVISVTQEWEYKDTILHKAWSVCDAGTMQPLTHKIWWNIPRMGLAAVDFENKTVELNGNRLSDADTSRMAKRVWTAYKSAEGKFLLNWHLDLEVFSMLPYKAGAVFSIPFYDPGTGAPFENAVYTVKGAGKLLGYDNQSIDCWLLVHESDNNKEVFWVSKKTKEVLKLEQKFGKSYRFKIKLGFSN